MENSNGGVSSGGGKRPYVAFYRGKRLELEAETSFAAQKAAAGILKAKKSWEVTVVLADVVHVAVD